MSLGGPRPMLVSQQVFVSWKKVTVCDRGISGNWAGFSRNRSKFVDRARLDEQYFAPHFSMNKDYELTKKQQAGVGYFAATGMLTMAQAGAGLWRAPPATLTVVIISFNTRASLTLKALETLYPTIPHTTRFGLRRLG